MPHYAARLLTRMNAPRILFLDQTAELGGAELALLDIIGHWREHCEVALFADGPLRARLQHAGISVHILSAKGDLGRYRGQSNVTQALMLAPNAIRLVLETIRRAKLADVIYANSQKAFVIGAIAAALTGRALVWHLHDILTTSHFSKANRNLVVWLANRLARSVIANSAATAASFRASGGTANVVVVHNGIDPAPFTNVDAQTARRALAQEIACGAAPIIGVFGRLTAWKGQNVAIEAMRRLPGVHLVLVGGPLFGEQACEAELRALATNAGLADRVHFLGFRNDVVSLMRAVDVVLHTSIAPEPFGRVIVEGMLAGKPVIATAGGGAPEIIEDGNTGLLVPPGDPEILSKSVSALLEAPERANALGIRAKEAATSRFSLAKSIDAIDQAINRAIRRREKVLFVDQSGELGGGELSLFDIARHRSPECNVLLFGEGRFEDRLKAAGIHVAVLSHAKKLVAFKKSATITLASAPRLLEFFRLVGSVTWQACKCDVIYANSQKAFIVACGVAFLTRRPLIWHLRDMLTSEHFSKSTRSIATRMANRFARIVVANSAATAQAFKEAGGKAPVVVIYNGFDPAQFNRPSAFLDREALATEIGSGDHPIVGVFGRLADWKGQHVAIKAMCFLKDTHLILVGSALFGEQNYEDSLRKMVAEVGLTKRVHFLGFQDDVSRLMSSMDIVLHTSTAPEPFGRVVVEGMLAGKPVIATNCGGVPEIIDDGKDGILVPPNDPGALSAAIADLLGAPVRAKELARLGRDAAIRRFSLEATLHSIDEVIASVSRRRERPTGKAIRPKDSI